MQILSETLRFVHLSEISVLIIESTQTTITSILLAELARHKIKVIFCDEKHNPYGELLSYYDRFNSPKKISLQINWNSEFKTYVADRIIKQKIVNQSRLLGKYGFNKESALLLTYASNIQTNDITNREGHAAKVYFNALFGKDFSRDDSSDTNAKLNYGYSLILSAVNRDVASNGCITQIGIKHINEYNDFNFSCDIMEVFRVVIDEFVYMHKDDAFNSEFKHSLVNILNKQIMLERNYYLLNAISITTKSIIDALNTTNADLLKLYDFK